MEGEVRPTETNTGLRTAVVAMIPVARFSDLNVARQVAETLGKEFLERSEAGGIHGIAGVWTAAIATLGGAGGMPHGDYPVVIFSGTVINLFPPAEKVGEGLKILSAMISTIAPQIAADLVTMPATMILGTREFKFTE